MTVNVTERAETSCSGFATAEGQGGRQGKHAANHNAERPPCQRERYQAATVGLSQLVRGGMGGRTSRVLYRWEVGEGCGQREQTQVTENMRLNRKRWQIGIFSCEDGTHISQTGRHGGPTNVIIHRVLQILQHAQIGVRMMVYDT